jgi:ketosteroid isomerase-like protein
MKNLVRFPASVIILICSVFINNYGQEIDSRYKKNILEKGKAELIKTELEFYKATQEKGWGQAFIEFADDSAALLRQDAFPVINKSAIIQLFKDKEGNVLNLKWTPAKAEISNDGSLGYTYGNWIFTSKDKDGKEEYTYGNYVTIWKKQPGGGWKFVLDGGNTTPPPVK